MTGLFRSEVIKHRAQRLDGAVVLASPLSMRVLAAFATLVMFCALGLASIASYARKETVTGWITPDRGLLRAVAVDGGRIESLSVVEGDVVALGDQIAAVRASSDIAEGDAGQVLVEGLATETEAARSVGDASQARLEAEAAQLRRHTASLLAEQQQIIRQIALQEERTRLQQVDVARAQVLADQGFFPRAQLEVRQAQALAAEQDLAALRQRKLSLDRDVIEVAARLDAIPIETSAARAASSMTIAQLEQRRADAQSRTRYIIRSPIAGRVAALPVRAGETLVPGASVATIVPEGSRLEAELYVPSRAAGFIREGQEVRLLYQAFPHQRFGAGHGEVVSVSRTVLTPSEVAMPSVHLDEPVFRVQVRLERDYVDAYGQRTPLQAGMLLTADVVIDRRSLLEWILDPIYAAGRR